MSEPTRPVRYCKLKCWIGLHRWQRIAFYAFSLGPGRRCRYCGKVQRLTRLGDWMPTTAAIREDAHGYY